MCQFQNYVTLGQKINAIKELRALTGVGLKEAKEMVESLPAFAVPKLDADCNPNHEHYVVVQGMGDGTDYVTHFAGHYDNRDEAIAYARDKVERNDVVVARVIVKTTRSLDVL